MQASKSLNLPSKLRGPKPRYKSRLNRVFADIIIAAKGVIVHTGSTAEYGPLPLGAVYNASKAAMRMYANTLRVEMRPFGMRVVDIVTGGVKTEMWNKSKIEILKGV
jgi:short-subunit dehydrogenase